MKIRLALFLLGLSLPLSASAVSVLLGAEGNDRCGVGSMLFDGNQAISSQGSEEGTNSAFLDSASITVGTSGCTRSGIVSVPQKEIFYANANYEELMTEMAAGRGDSLIGFAQEMGCQPDAIPLYLQTSKENYRGTFPNSATSPLQMIINFRKGLRTNPQLVQKCSSLNS